jgi:hypothetical protein
MGASRLSVLDASEAETDLLIRSPHPIAVTRDRRLVFHVPCLSDDENP